jgi:uncharacterized membrane protein SpoIIM required for sporulation
VIIDIESFIHSQQSIWSELEVHLERLERDHAARLRLEDVKRLHWLYQRTVSDLSRLGSLAADPDLKLYLEGLVARAYGEIHGGRRHPTRFHPVRWFFQDFPQTFRRYSQAFFLAVAITLLGALCGGTLTAYEPEAKEVILPFSHLQGDPSERVDREESAASEGAEQENAAQSRYVSFASQLMTHNTQVAIFALALGISFGVGTLVLLFYNGAVLGAVVFDYVRAGEGLFLTGWLLPHGSIEIPAFILAGQAGLVLAGALLGRASGLPLGQRLRTAAPDLVTLIGGVAVFLVWAGIIESFISQHHQPVLPYSVKIAFGAVQLGLLVLLLTRGGSRPVQKGGTHV